MILLIDGQVANKFSYDGAGLQQAINAYTEAGGKEAGADLVVDTNELTPQIEEVVGQFLLPMEGRDTPQVLLVEEAQAAGVIPPAQSTDMPGGQSMAPTPGDAEMAAQMMSMQRPGPGGPGGPPQPDGPHNMSMQPPGPGGPPPDAMEQQTGEIASARLARVKPQQVTPQQFGELKKNVKGYGV